MDDAIEITLQAWLMIVFALPPPLSLIGILLLAAAAVVTIHIARYWRD